MNRPASHGVREAMCSARARSMSRARARGCALAVFLLAAGCVPHVARSGAASLHAASAGLGASRTRPVGTPKQPSLPPPWSSAPAPGPGERVLAVAERMVSRGTIVRGSCYDYVSAVFAEAGYPAARRDQVFRGSMDGPYADLSLIVPGDWLAIVNHPERTPVGTHSVIFARWQDRARAEAVVVSYAGGGSVRPGDFVVYDLSRTYRITRAVDSTPP